MYIALDDHWLFEGVKSLRGVAPPRLKRLIESASKEIDEYCGTRFKPTGDTYSLDFCRHFHPRKRPLLEVTGLSLNGVLLTENTDFYAYPDTSRIDVEAENPGGYRKALEISYTYGYNEIPATIKQVIVDLIRFDVESGSVPTSALQSESWDTEHSYTRFASKDMTATELRKGILARLDAFKVLPVLERQKAGDVRARLI